MKEVSLFSVFATAALGAAMGSILLGKRSAPLILIKPQDRSFDDRVGMFDFSGAILNIGEQWNDTNAQAYIKAIRGWAESQLTALVAGEAPAGAMVDFNAVYEELARNNYPHALSMEVRELVEEAHALYFIIRDLPPEDLDEVDEHILISLEEVVEMASSIIDVRFTAIR